MIQVWGSRVPFSLTNRKMYFRYFLVITLGKGYGPLFEQTWIPFTQGCFVRSLVEIGPVVLEKKILKFLLFRYYLPLEKDMVFHSKKNLTPLHLRMLCAKFGWYWPSGSGEGNENLNRCIWAFSIGELPRFGLSRGVGLFKLSIARGRAGWRTLHVYVAVRLCQNWQTMDCRTMDLSDYRTFGIWSCWTIGLFDYGSSCWTIIGLSDY